MTSRPIYIALEGVKGVGKGSVLSWLTEQLTMRGMSYVSLNPTQPLEDNSYWEQLDRALPLRELDWWREHLYAARSQLHAQRAALEVERARSSERPVELILGDRSVFTSLVTRWPNTPTPETVESRYRAVRALESEIPVPDHVLYLDAPLEVVEARIAGRERRYGREDESRARLIEAQEAYRYLTRSPIDATREVKWRDIDASLSLEEVQSAVLEAVMGCLKEWQIGACAAHSTDHSTELSA